MSEVTASKRREQLEEAESVRKGDWLNGFGMLVISVVLALSIERVAGTGIFSPRSQRSTWELLRAGLPLVFLYLWIVYLGLAWSYYAQWETPMMVSFARPPIGFHNLLFVMLFGLILYHALNAVTPDFTTLTPEEVNTRVDYAIRWLVLLLAFDAMNVVSMWSAVTQAIASHRAKQNDWVPHCQVYAHLYLFCFPCKFAIMAVAFLCVWFPGLPFLPEWTKYPLLTVLGLPHDRTWIAGSLLVAGLLSEIALTKPRSRLQAAYYTRQFDAQLRGEAAHGR